MIRTFFLITNCSGVKYWSYLGTAENTTDNLARMVAKHGNIYINDVGGWFPQNCVREIHAVLIQRDWPTNII